MNGIWTLLFLGRTSMIAGWIDIIRSLFSTKRADFVSVDARGFSASPKTYEMLTSPPPQPSNMPKTPRAVVTSPRNDREEGLSPLPQSPRSVSSENTMDYFGKEADYKSPQLSFSTPRPPSAGRTLSRSGNERTFSPRIDSGALPPDAQLPRSDSAGRPLSLGRDSPTRPFSPSRRESGSRSFSPAYEWDPIKTHAKPSGR